MTRRPGHEQQRQAPGGSPTDNTGKPARRGRLLRVLYGLALLTALVTALLALAATGPVLRLATPAINRAVSAAIDGRFALGRSRGSLWTGLTVESLVLELQSTGLRVDGRQLELEWTPLALFTGVLQIDRLAASSLSVVLPGDGGAAPTRKEVASGPFSLPLAIRLGQLGVPELHIVDPASGRRFLYKLGASGAAKKNMSAELALTLLPLDTAIDRLRADLSFDADRGELHAELNGHFDRAGIVMTLAGLRPEEAADLTFSLQGRGPADGWRGELSFIAGELAELSGEIGVQLLGERVGFTFSGLADTLGNLADRLPASLRGAVDIGLAGHFEIPTNRLALSKLELGKPELITLSAGADVDLAAGRLVADLQAKIAAAASRLLDDAVQWQDLLLEAHAEGDLTMPDVSLTVKGHSVTTPVSTIGQLMLTLNMTAADDRFSTRVHGTARQAAWTDPDLALVFGDRLDITFDADIAENFGRVLIDHLVIATPDIQLTGRAEFDDATRVSNAGLQAEIADLSIFSALSGLELSGAGRVAVSNGTWDPADGGQADLVITGKQLGFGQADLDRLVGPQPVVKGRLDISPQSDLGIKLGLVETAMVNGTGLLSVTDQFSTIHVSSDLTIQPGAMPPGIGVSLPKAARLTASLDGPLAAPAGDIRLTIPTLETGGERFDNLELTSSLNWSQEAVLSLLNLIDFELRGKPYQLRTDVVLATDRLQLDNIALNGEALELTGQLHLPGYQTPIQGSVSLSRLDAGLFADWGAPISAGRVDAKVDFVPAASRQRIEFNMGAKDLRLTGLGGTGSNGIDTLAVRGHIDDSFGDQPIVELRLNSSRIVAGQAAVESMQATLQGDLSQLRATLEAEGRFEERLPVTLAASTDLAMGEDLRMTVDSLNVDIGSQRIALRRPLQLTRTATGVLEAETVLAVGGEGQVDVNVRLIPDKEFGATAEVRDIALGPWGDMFAQKDMSGTLSLAATLNEQAGKPPRARFDAGIDDFRLVHAGQLPPLSLRLAGTLSEGRATVDLLLGQPDTQLIKADAAVPFALSILNGRGEVDPKAPITAHAAVDGEISQFWSYLPLPDHATAGQIKLTADLSGSLAAPVLAGAVNLRDGRYEHLQFGTLLRNIDLDGRFNERGLEIASITANDGGKGTLTGKAEVEMDGRSGLTYSAEMTLRDMAVTRMDELKVWADIDMNITGDDHAAEISSNVTVNHGEVDLEVALPPSVPQLEIANLPRPEDDSKEDHAATNAFVADLDVKVNIPGLLFVRGKGLDSEWAGNLEITGTADSPRIVGGLFARRGRLDIIGKTFLIRDSKITFFGGQPPDPILDIAGIYNTSDLVVTASLSGPASSTELTLSSQPFLPQEEILSRVLFGTSQGNLTALQAFQLAGVVSKMSGVGGGLDVIGSLRNFLNVDVLRVEGGESGPEVEMGKYLTEGVYVGTKQGTARGSTGIEVEIELTPNIKVTSENNEIDNKTGIQFKWDY